MLRGTLPLAAPNVQEDWSPASIATNWREGQEPFPGAGFTRSDDIWDLSFRETRAVYPDHSILNFSVFPLWLGQVVKDFLAWAWLAQDFSNSYLRKLYYGIYRMGSFIAENRPEIQSVNQFDAALARSFEHAVKSKATSIKSKRLDLLPLKVFVRWARLNNVAIPPEFNPSDRCLPLQPETVDHLDLVHKVVPEPVRDQILKALVVEESRLTEQLKQPSPGTKSKHLQLVHKQLLFCQVVKLLVVSGRRASHILYLEREPLHDSRPGEADGVWLTWNETKTNQGEQSVFIPAPMDVLARDAVAVAQQLTEGLVSKAAPVNRRYLFLAEARQGAVTLADVEKVLNEYAPANPDGSPRFLKEERQCPHCGGHHAHAHKKRPTYQAYYCPSCGKTHRGPFPKKRPTVQEIARTLNCSYSVLYSTEPIRALLVREGLITDAPSSRKLRSESNRRFLVAPLIHRELMYWLNDSKHGFVYRHRILHNDAVYTIRTHSFRHTRATLLRSGGAGYGTVKQDLAHLSDTMTAVYIHSSEQVAAEVQQMHDARQDLSGVPSMIKEKSVRDTPITSDELERWREQGLVAQPNHYGYCVLPLESGICPSGDPCWLGPHGDGCPYHVCDPSAREAIEADAELIRSQLTRWESDRPNSPYLGHLRTLMRRYTEVIQGFSG